MSNKASEHTVGPQHVTFNGIHPVVLRNIIGIYTLLPSNTTKCLYHQSRAETCSIYWRYY